MLSCLLQCFSRGLSEALQSSAQTDRHTELGNMSCTSASCGDNLCVGITVTATHSTAPSPGGSSLLPNSDNKHLIMASPGLHQSWHHEHWVEHQPSCATAQSVTNWAASFAGRPPQTTATPTQRNREMWISGRKQGHIGTTR